MLMPVYGEISTVIQSWLLYRALSTYGKTLLLCSKLLHSATRSKQQLRVEFSVLPECSSSGTLQMCNVSAD